MKKILVGYIEDGKTSGIDKYLLNFLDKINSDDIQVDFLTRCYNEEFVKQLNEKGCKVYQVSRNRHFFKQIKEMKKILKNENYDIAYFNISEAYNCVGIVSSKLFGVKKIVVHSHSSDVEKSNFLKRKMAHFLNYLSKVFISLCSDLNLACSDKAAKWLFSKNVYDNEDYFTIYNAVDYNKFKYNEKIRKKIRKQLKIDDKFVVGHVGRFSYQKNHKFLIDTFYEYMKINSNAVLVCVGDGPEFEKIKKYARKKQVFDNVLFMGSINNVNEIMQAFDCFLLPSNFEGLPIVGVEAQLTQTKCIFSSKITRMTLISNDNLYLPIKKPKVWAKAISSKKTKFNDEVNNFKLEDNKKQFNIIFDNISGRFNLPYILLKSLLIVHYVLNLTVFFNGFNYLAFICGLLLIMILFMDKFAFFKYKFKDKKIFILYLLFLLSYIVSHLIIKVYDANETIKLFIWTVLYFFFIFDCKYLKNKKDLKKEIYFLIKLSIVSVSLVNIHNLYLLVNHSGTVAHDFNKVPHLLGLSPWGRFFGNYFDANYASIVCTVMIIFAFYLLKVCKSKKDKILLITSIILQLIYIYFGQSRTGIIALFVALLCYILFNYLIYKINLKKLIISLIMLIVVVFVLPKISLNMYNCLTNLNSHKNVVKIKEKKCDVCEEDNLEEDNLEDPAKIGRQDYEKDVSNGRFSIWESGYEIFKVNKVFGIGINNVVKYSLKNMPKLYIVHNARNAKFDRFHNVIIDIFVSQGIVGIVISIAIIIYFIIVMIKVFKKVKNNNELFYIFTVFMSIIISIIVSSMFVSQILYVNNFISFLFWMGIGYVYLLLDSRVNND